MFDLLSVSHFPIESWVAGMWSAFFQSLFVLAVLSTVTLFGGQGVSTPDAEKLIPVVVVVTVLLDWGTLMVFGSPLPE